MRIFIGIDLDPEVRTRIERFLEGVEGFAPEARWVRPESLPVHPVEPRSRMPMAAVRQQIQRPPPDFVERQELRQQ